MQNASDSSQIQPWNFQNYHHSMHGDMYSKTYFYNHSFYFLAIIIIISVLYYSVMLFFHGFFLESRRVTEGR
jgi:hypothetical protein